jgi:hypothetical protein
MTAVLLVDSLNLIVKTFAILRGRKDMFNVFQHTKSLVSVSYMSTMFNPIAPIVNLPQIMLSASVTDFPQQILQVLVLTVATRCLQVWVVVAVDLTRKVFRLLQNL